MKVNDRLVDELSALSRLEFRNEEKESIKQDLQKMIAFIGQLNEVDTTGVEPLRFMNEEVNVLREDVVTSTISRSEGLMNAPVKDDEYFKVPKVIKK